MDRKEFDELLGEAYDQINARVKRRKKEERLAKKKKAAEEPESTQLKLYTCRVIWDNFFDKENSWFIVLGEDAEDVEEAVIRQVGKWSGELANIGAVIKMEVTEITGPFKTGQILHEEVGGDKK